ncbi:MAG: trypsin-like peptidase domain-containing protein [Pirellulaceae bacterium]|nr:trypsin-like peptidase domain-containing protein [Pirellulaceae bacterium]
MSLPALPTGSSLRLLLALMICGLGCLAPRPADASKLRRTATVVAVERAAPAVVNIHGRKTVRAEPGLVGAGDTFRQVNGMGTGVVIDERGYIITNFHVVEGVGRIQVSLADGSSAVGQLLAHDPQTDLAILKIPVTQPMDVITIGTSSDLMRGEPVIAVGNAYGYDHTVTEGIISALNRPVQVSDEQKYQGLIQTDASINPGNSGGPLLNIDGEMVGINVAVRVGAQGIGFAIPVDEAMEVAARLMSVERLERIRHGITGRTVTETGHAHFEVTTVDSLSPAGKAGLESGDIVRRIEQREVHRGLDIERFLLERRVDEKIELTIERDGDPLTVVLTLDEVAPVGVESTDLAWDVLGLRLLPVSPQLFRQYNSRYRGGLKVTSLRTGGPGAEQGIRVGDVLVGVHKWETVTPENITYILNSDEVRRGQPVKFYVLRGTETLYGQLRLN